MRKTQICCDHCGKELDEIHDYPNMDVGFIGYEEADLCAECLEELNEIIEKFCKRGGLADA